MTTDKFPRTALREGEVGRAELLAIYKSEETFAWRVVG
jgi:hypothetical protein